MGPRVGLHGCGKSRPHRNSITIRKILRRQNLCKSVKFEKNNDNVNNNNNNNNNNFIITNYLRFQTGWNSYSYYQNSIL